MRGLFDGPSTPSREPITPQHTPEPLTPKVKTPEYGPDVVRVIEHKAGPFRRHDNTGKVIEEYRYLEMVNGRYTRETMNGDSRIPAPWITKEMVDSSIESGMWREVKREAPRNV